MPKGVYKRKPREGERFRSYEKQALTIRLDPDLYLKVHGYAGREGRTIVKQIEQDLRKVYTERGLVEYQLARP